MTFGEVKTVILTSNSDVYDDRRRHARRKIYSIDDTSKMLDVFTYFSKLKYKYNMKILSLVSEKNKYALCLALLVEKYARNNSFCKYGTAAWMDQY